MGEFKKVIFHTVEPAESNYKKKKNIYILISLIPLPLLLFSAYFFTISTILGLIELLFSILLYIYLRVREKYYLRIVRNGLITIDNLGFKIAQEQTEFIAYEDIKSISFNIDRFKAVVHKGRCKTATYIMTITLINNSKKNIYIERLPINGFREVYRDYIRTMEALKISDFNLYKKIRYDLNIKGK